MMDNALDRRGREDWAANCQKVTGEIRRHLPRYIERLPRADFAGAVFGRLTLDYRANTVICSPVEVRPWRRSRVSNHAHVPTEGSQRCLDGTMKGRPRESE